MVTEGEYVPMREEFLEPLLRHLRIRRIMPVLRNYPHCCLLDVGCGWQAGFLKAVAPYIDCGVGIDMKAPEISTDKITTRRVKLDDRLPFDDASFDVVTMLAVLEHVQAVDAIVHEIHRVLRPGGVFCGTVPSVWAKPVLEFLSFKCGIVNPDEIRDHKRYFTRDSLQKLFVRNGFGVNGFSHHYFQLGMNNFFCVLA